MRGRPDLDLDRGSEGRVGERGSGEGIRRSGGGAGWAWWVGPVGGCGLLGRSPVGGLLSLFFCFVFCFLFFIYFLLISVL